MSKRRARFSVSDVLLIAGLTLFLVSVFQPFMVTSSMGRNYPYGDLLSFPELSEARLYAFKIDYYQRALIEMTACSRCFDSQSSGNCAMRSARHGENGKIDKLAAYM